MSTFVLNLEFSIEGLNNIFATNSYIAIAKPIETANPNVVWQHFKPFQANTIQFEEEVGLYASHHQSSDTVVITSFTKTPIPAEAGQLYTLENTGNITGPAEGGTPNEYSMKNNYAAQPYMTMGLYQGAVINGMEMQESPISANEVLLNSTISMTPDTTLVIWVESQLATAALVNSITSPTTTIKFSPGTNQLTYRYDEKTGTFVPAEQ